MICEHIHIDSGARSEPEYVTHNFMFIIEKKKISLVAVVLLCQCDFARGIKGSIYKYTLNFQNWKTIGDKNYGISID